MGRDKKKKPTKAEKSGKKADSVLLVETPPPFPKAPTPTLSEVIDAHEHQMPWRARWARRVRRWGAFLSLAIAQFPACCSDSHGEVDEHESAGRRRSMEAWLTAVDPVDS